MCKKRVQESLSVARIEFNKRVEYPFEVMTSLSLIAALFLPFFAMDTFNIGELFLKASVCGVISGLIFGVLIGWHYVDVLSGLMEPFERVLSFCFGCCALNGLIFIVLASLINSFILIASVNTKFLTLSFVCPKKSGT